MLIPVFSYAGSISDINSLNNIELNNLENMTPSMTFQTQKPRLVDVYYDYFYPATQSGLQIKLDTVIGQPMTAKAIDGKITLTQNLGLPTAAIGYIKSASWRSGSERYFVLHSSSIPNDFSNSSNFKPVQDYCEQNGIKLISINWTAKFYFNSRSNQNSD